MATEAPRQDDGTEAPQEERRRGLRVAWLAGARTFARFGRVLEPLAIGLMDEPIRLVVACPEEAEIRGLPEPAVEIIRYRRPHWWNPYRRRWLEDLAGRLREMKITLVHSLEADRAAEARYLARRIDARYIVSCWSLSDRHRLWSAGSRCAAILAGSESIRRSASRKTRWLMSSSSLCVGRSWRVELSARSSSSSCRAGGVVLSSRLTSACSSAVNSSSR